MTSTTRQPKVSKTHETASQKAGTAIYTGNMSQIQTSFRTISTPKTRTKANTSHSTRRPASRTHQFHSHSEPQTCCMHVHQQQSQTCKMGEPPTLREVKHPHRDRTSVSRSPSTEQGVLSQFLVTLKKQDISQGIRVQPNLSHAFNRQYMHPRNKR